MEKALRVRASNDKVVAVSSITEPILVELSQTGLTVEGRLVPVVELAGVLRAMMAERKSGAVSVLAQRQVSHGRVIEVLDCAMAAGAQELDLLDPSEESHGPS